MEHDDIFHTLKGYQLIEEPEFTPAMEDYLEMICRLLYEKKDVRVGELSGHLNVRPSSASKMIRQLDGLGYLRAEKYGNITLTEKGRAAGNYLLYRHDVINRFLCYINNSEGQLEETEKIEHFVSRRTTENLDRLLCRLGEIVPQTVVSGNGEGKNPPITLRQPGD